MVIFEGWCVGARAQSSSQLKKPINSLEKVYDQGTKWRTHVNNQLKTKYKELAEFNLTLSENTTIYLDYELNKRIGIKFELIN